MVQVEDSDPVTLAALIIASLAIAEALAKLLVERGLITEAEFTERPAAERATYQKLLREIPTK